MVRFATGKGGRYRWVRRLLGALALVAVSYVALQCFPQAAFAYRAKSGNFTVYSAAPVDSNVDEVVRQADSLLRRSSIYDASPQKVFLTDSNFKYYFFAPHAPGSFGVAMQFSRNIFFRSADIRQDKLRQRTLSGLLAHERTHVLVEKKLGVFRANTAPGWKKEGYPEYISAAPIPLSDEARARVKTSGLGAILRMHNGYVAYHLRVKYLMEVEKVSFDELFAREFDLAQLDRRVAENIDRLVTN